MTPLLPAALTGQRIEFDSRAVRLCAYVAGQGPALLLVHSINASASAAEVRPLHEYHRATRTVVLDRPAGLRLLRPEPPATTRAPVPERFCEACERFLAVASVWSSWVLSAARHGSLSHLVDHHFPIGR